MRAYLPDYELRTPHGLPEVLDLIRSEPEVWRPMAGGTDLMVVLETGRLQHKKYINLWGISELKGITVSRDWVSIGALSTYAEIRDHAVLSQEFPMLVQAACMTGAVAIQNRGTLGGNIANASPAADTPPALLAYGAEIELVSAQSARKLAYDRFHTGYKKTEMRSDELVARVWLPRRDVSAPDVLRQRYRKVGTRKAQAISKVCMSAYLVMQDTKVTEIRLAWGSVGPMPLRARLVETRLRGSDLNSSTIDDAVHILATELKPIDDIRSSADYRSVVAQNILRDFLETP